MKPKQVDKKSQPATASTLLQGWTAIARYLGIPVATAHRWTSEGMPVRHEGRFTVAGRDAVSTWLGHESHMPKPAHVMTEDTDVAAALAHRLDALSQGGKEFALEFGVFGQQCFCTVFTLN